MKTVAELRKELVGMEISFTKLDNTMMTEGYYSVFDDGATTEIKEDLNVVYTSKETNEATVKIDFEIVIDNADDEAQEAFILKVTEVEEF